MTMHNTNVKALLLIYFQYKHPSCEWKSIFGEGFTLSTMTNNYEWSDDTTTPQYYGTTKCENTYFKGDNL